MKGVPNGYRRRILATGSNMEMIKLEQTLLENRKEKSRWEKYHNIKLGIHPYPWDDPEFRKKHTERMKAQWADTEWRERQRATCSVCGYESTRAAITRCHNDKCICIYRKDGTRGRGVRAL